MSALQNLLFLRPSHAPLLCHRPRAAPLSSSTRLSAALRRHGHRLSLASAASSVPHHDTDPAESLSGNHLPGPTTPDDNKRAMVSSDAEANSDEVRSPENLEEKEEEVRGEMAPPPSRLPVMVFMIGFMEAAKKGMDKIAASEWMSWWPLGGHERFLQQLITEADANPKDAIKQSALLAELNKHRSSFEILL